MGLDAKLWVCDVRVVQVKPHSKLQHTRRNISAHNSRAAHRVVAQSYYCATVSPRALRVVTTNAT